MDGNDLQGAAYLFPLGDGAATLTALDGAADDWFGRTVAIDGDTALVGADAADVAGVRNQGAVYVFVRNGAGRRDDAGWWQQPGVGVARRGRAGGRGVRGVAVCHEQRPGHPAGRGTGDADVTGVICDETIAGVHAGSLTVAEGVTCLVAGARVWGEVNVLAGAGLVATAAVIQGPVSAVGASRMELVFSQVTGPVLVSGSTGTTSVFASQVTGSVTPFSNRGPSAVAGNTIIGSLSCFANDPPPVDHDLPNPATGGKLGQCAGL